MTPQEALTGLRTMIETQGPDTANRHYGRKQFVWLIECCDTLQAALQGDDIEEIDLDEISLHDLLEKAAEMEIEELDADSATTAWLTADDLAGRLRARLKELRYWWTP